MNRWKRIKNSFAFKVGISLFAISMIPFIIFIFVNVQNISTHFALVEEEQINKSASQLQNIIDSKIQDIVLLTVDYSAWDDTYYSLLNKDASAFFEDNYSEWLPDNFGVDLIILSNNDMTYIESFGIESNFMNEWFEEVDWSSLTFDEHPSGFKKVNNKLYMFSLSPVVQSDFSGDPVGTLILAEEIDSALLVEMKDQYGYDIFIANQSNVITNFDETDEFRTSLDKMLTDDLQLVLGESNNYANLDMFNTSIEKIAILGIVESRETYVTVLNLMQSVGYITIVVTSVLVVLLGAHLQYVLVKPISQFESQMVTMTKNNKIDFIKTNGSIEIENLANAYNIMIEKLFDQSKENKKLWKDNNIDSLTLLYNHRFFHEHLESHLAVEHQHLTLLFCDIDKFKAINDSYGHSAGDKVLKDIGKIILRSVPKNMKVFRYGGEEFVVVLLNHDTEMAMVVAEEIRRNIAKSIQLKEDAHYISTTISIGLASYPKDAITVQELIDKADSAMYYAKQNGRNQCRCYDQEMEAFLLNNSEEFAKQEQLIDSAFALAAAIDAKDVYTGKHSELVTKYALLLAEKLKFSERDKQLLRVGALLHDCGKIGIPDNIITKLSRLTPVEFEIIKNHTVFGNNIVKHIVKSSAIVSCVRNHHERWDGNGYPDGLKGEDIPIFARIVCVVDTFHAMVSARPYRSAISKKEAFIELRKSAGSQFDPALVEVFIEMINETSNFDLIAQEENLETIYS
jgi:diguanylate cyclase (GGDEF)-like protein/putative nucleotidyltransferase with HDIG domain